MKRRLVWGIAIVLITLVMGPGVVLAEQIESYETRLSINLDGTVGVMETIVYNFTGEEKHGIYRDIPIEYEGALGSRYRLRLHDITVSDQHGVALPFETSKDDGVMSLRIGDPDVLVSGTQVYRIGYTAERALGFFDDHTELYWNAVGTGWPVPVAQASAVVMLPPGISQGQLHTECFSGLMGATRKCASTQVSGDPASEVRFTSVGLPVHEGFTVVVGFPPGIIKHSAWTEIGYAVADNWYVVIPIATLIFCFVWWWNKGRDPKGRGTIIPQFDAPDNLMPAELGTIVDEKPEVRDVSAEFIYLASRGYLTITREVKERTLLPDQVDYMLKKVKTPDAALHLYQKELLDRLFASAGDGESVKLSALRNKFYKEFAVITELLQERMVELEYYPKNPKAAQKPMMTVGSILLLGGMFGWELFASEWAGGSLVVAGIIACIFGARMTVRTPKGVEAKEHALGLKMYLGVAEKDRLAFHNAPEKNPTQFEAYLPYAMVLGVEKAWAQQFDGIATAPPSWYHGSAGQAFVASAFVHDLSVFRNQVNANLATAPGKSGGSGFGGSSGGGFGGGGGRSW